MKLYNFEKYYLRFAKYRLFLFLCKVITFSEKIWKYSIGRIILIFFIYITFITIAGMILVYFFLGVNSVLDKFNLGQYKIMEFPLMQVKVNLKDFYNH